MTGRPTDKAVPDAAAHVVRYAFDWRRTQKAMIGADGENAIAASSAHRRAGRKLAEAVDLAERSMPRDFGRHSARLDIQIAAVKVVQVTAMADSAAAIQASEDAAQDAIDAAKGKAVQP